MTTPKARRDEEYRRWCSWAEVVREQLVRAHFHQSIWTQVRDAAVSRYPNSDHSWVVSYTKVYADAQMVLIRRVAEDSPEAASLGRLIRRIRDDPNVITRTHYCNTAVRHGIKEVESAREWDMRWASEPGDEKLDPRIPSGDYDSLKSGRIHRVIKRAQKTVAHLDAAVALAIQGGHSPKDLPKVTYEDIRKALSELASMTNRYLSLLKRYEIGDWTPVMQGDWQAPLRSSLFPFDPSIYTWSHESFV